MDLGISTVPAIVASSTTSYLVQFSPVFVLIGGIVLAFVVISYLISILTGRDVNPFDDGQDNNRNNGNL